MTTSERVSITALAVGLIFAIAGMIMAVNGNGAGIWVLVTGVGLFGVVKIAQNIILIRRALRKNRLN
ncbi:MAG: hypothetical protein ACOH1T_05065 [Microbacteriaceae bacterium]